MRDLEWSILWQRKSTRREGGNACRKHTLGDFRFTKFSEVRQQLARKFEGRSKTDVRHLRIHREFIGDGTNAPLHALPYAARSPLAYGSNPRYEYGGLRGSPTNAPSPRLSHRLSVLQPSHALPP